MIKKIFPAILAIFSSFFFINSTQAQESYANVTIQVPEDWHLRQMKLFTGSLPSKAWVFDNNQAEVLVSVINAEGIREGLTNPSKATLIRLYTEEFVSGWGGKIDKTATHEFEAATFCDGHAGVEVKATFGQDTYIYYGCLKHNQDWTKLSTVVTWMKTPEPPVGEIQENSDTSSAAQRLSGFLAGIQYDQ